MFIKDYDVLKEATADIACAATVPAATAGDIRKNASRAMTLLLDAEKAWSRNRDVATEDSLRDLQKACFYIQECISGIYSGNVDVSPDGTPAAIRLFNTAEERIAAVIVDARKEIEDEEWKNELAADWNEV